MRNLLLLFLGLLVSGCGGSSLEAFFPGGTTPGATITLSGRAFLASDVAGATVRALDSSGATLANGLTRSDGSFQLVGPLASAALVVLDLPGSDLQFAAPLGSGQRYVVINIPTSLAVMMAAQGAEPAQALAQVETLLGAPAGSRLDLLAEDSTVAPFSHLAFLQTASEQGGWSAFSSALLAGSATAGQSQELAPPPYRLSAKVLTAPLGQLEPGLRELAEKARGEVVVLDAQDDSSAILSGLSSLGQGIASSIADPLVNDALSWIAGAMGFNFGTTDKVNEALQLLSDIQSEIGTVEGQLDKLGIKIETFALSTMVVDGLDDLVTDFLNFSTSGDPDFPSISVSLTDQLPLPAGYPASSAANLLSSLLQGFSTYQKNLTELQNALLGLQLTNNVFTAFQQELLTQNLGLDMPARFGGQPVRSYKINGAQTGFLNYYAGYQTYALDGAVEYVHSSATTATNPPGPSVAGQITALIWPTARTAAESLKLQQQQVVGAVPSQSIIVDLEYGLMWYSKVYPAADYDQAVSDAANLSVGVAPGVTYDDWRLPTYEECVALQNRGRYTTTKDPNANVNSDTGYADTGMSSAGLTSLGFQGVPNMNLGPSDNPAAGTSGSGDIWMLAYSYNDRDERTLKLGQVEFRLNFENDNTQSTDDPRCYIMVRSIGKPLLSYLAPENIDGVDEGDINIDSTTGLPVEMLPFNNPVDAEYPFLGVPTKLSLSVDEGLSQVSAQIEYTIALGGTFTHGKDTTLKQVTVDSASFGPVSADGTTQVAYSITDNNPAEPLPIDQMASPALDVSNFPGSEGALTWHSSTGSALSGLFVSGSVKGFQESFPVDLVANLAIANQTPPVAQLTRIEIQPRNVINESTSPNFQFQCLGFYSDQTVADLTSAVNWQVVKLPVRSDDPSFVPDNVPAGAVINTGGDFPGLLQFSQTIPFEADGLLIGIQATMGSGTQALTDLTNFNTVTDLDI